MADIAPTRIEMDLGNGLGMSTELDPGAGLTLDTEASYTFEGEFNGEKWTALEVRVAHWDASTGVAVLRPGCVVIH